MLTSLSKCHGGFIRHIEYETLSISVVCEEEYLCGILSMLQLSVVIDGLAASPSLLSPVPT